LTPCNFEALGEQNLDLITFAVSAFPDSRCRTLEMNRPFNQISDLRELWKDADHCPTKVVNSPGMLGAIVLLRTKAAFCLVYRGGGGCEYRARRCHRSLLGLSPNLKSSAAVLYGFRFNKNARGQSSPELNSRNERLWNASSQPMLWLLRESVGLALQSYP